MKWKLFIKPILLFCFLIILFLIQYITIVISSYTLYSGNFNLYLNQNNSVGSQLLEYYVAIQYLNATPINTTANIYGRLVNEVYTSRLRFISNVNGKIRILTNLNQTQNHIIEVSINNKKTLMVNNDIFSFSNGDNIIILFEIVRATVTKAYINAIIGSIGIGLFCANPVLSYILTNKAKDKFHFLFILMAIGIISLGLIFSFIYGGI